MSGELTAEMRFWWPGEAPAAVTQWFTSLGPCRTERRIDTYCLTGRTDWGIKQRGNDGPIESKAALAARLALPLSDVPDARLWLKQQVDREHLAGRTIALAKQRKIFTICDAGGEPRCEIELGLVQAGEGEDWTTLCFEAQADLADPLRNLTLAWSGGRGLPGGLASGRCASYPEWLMALEGS